MTNYQKPELIHFNKLDTLSSNDIYYLIEKALELRHIAIDKKNILPLHSGRVMSALFFEPSTRTLNSFLLAAERLDMITLAPTLSMSATQKGESLIDTVQTFEAMGTDVFVVRHGDNHTAEFIANELKQGTWVINAGDGTNRHPTQALLDLMTIYEHKKEFEKLSVAIVGDIDHSRVANSLIIALKTVGVTDLRLVGPKELLDTSKHTEAQCMHKLSDGIKDADVIICLRIQKERFEAAKTLDLKAYQKNFCVDDVALEHAKPDAIVMHPGPINRNIEISSKVADSTRSTIKEQVKNGVAMRMAILDTLLTNR